jgi:hypothetical protein
MADKGLNLGWHTDCGSCCNIMYVIKTTSVKITPIVILNHVFMHRLIEESDRKQVLHHQMLDNMFIAHHMILEDLEAWEKFNENSAPPTDQEVQNPAKRLCEKAQQRFPEDKECFDTMVKISAEVEIGETNLFHCDQYEHYLRSLNRIAGLIGAETSKKQIDFFYLLPFDYPLSLPLDKKDDPYFEKKAKGMGSITFHLDAQARR